MTKRRKRGTWSGPGTRPLDRIIPEVGRITRASGTKDPAMFLMLDSMLLQLREMGRIDLLHAIHDGVLTPLDVWDVFRRGQLAQAPTPETLKPLRKTADGWVARYKGRRGEGVSDRHRYELSLKLGQLADLGTKDATLADLPMLLRRARLEAEERGTHRTFNYHKSAAQAFIRSVIGRGSALYQAIAAIDPLKVTKRRRGQPQPVARAIELRAALGTEAGAIWWTMCCTGMGPDEFWRGKWKVRDGHLEVRGTKRERRNRVVPLLVVPVAPAFTYREFAELLATQTGGKIQPYDGRRTFAHFMELAKIDRSRRLAYFGHAGGDPEVRPDEAAMVLDRYEAHDVQPYLQADTAALLALIGEPGPALRLVRSA